MRPKLLFFLSIGLLCINTVSMAQNPTNTLRSAVEFKDYLSAHYLQDFLVTDLSSNEVVYYYDLNYNSIVAFNFEAGTGTVKPFAEALNDSPLPPNQFRSIVASSWGGLQHSRVNYFEAASQIPDFEAMIPGLLAKFELEISDLERMSPDSWVLLLDSLSSKLCEMAVADVMTYELSVLALFVYYAQTVHENHWQIALSINTFAEQYPAIELVCKDNRLMNLSHVVYRFLYPDYDRDDYDDPADAIIVLKRIGDVIDYENGPNYLIPEHE